MIWIFIAGPHEKRLLQKLFSSYELSERPVLNESETLNVSVGLSLIQIVDVDEKKQIVTISGWLDLVKLLFIFNFFSQNRFVLIKIKLKKKRNGKITV